LWRIGLTVSADKEPSVRAEIPNSLTPRLGAETVDVVDPGDIDSVSTHYDGVL
jgi:hypothetical protein